MESVQSKQAPVKDGSSKASAVSGVNKPGRKFGLTGQRQVSPGNGSSGADGQHRFSVREEPRNSWMYSLSEQEMEEKYNATCLAIRTENLTLRQRLEHTHAERDLVESNLSHEVNALRSLFAMLKQEVARSQLLAVTASASGGPFKDGLGSGGWNELFVRVANQLDAVHSSAMRISSSAETLGAVEYEARLSAAVQVLILYVDHIKRKWEREHHELEETKRILKESGVNVAQCLATLPERHEQPAQGSRPVSKRRASFPAAPLRRISLRAPPSRASLLRDAGPALEHANTTVAAIAEEREDGDGDAPQKTPAVATPDDANNKPEANNNESAGSTNNNNNKDEDKSKPATSPPVTTRRKGVGGTGAYKSHSWSSGSGVAFSVLASRRQSEEASAASERRWTWLRAAGHWGRARWGRLRRRASVVRSTWRDQWGAVRDRKLELLRYGASACFLLAALFSLVVTFMPNSGKSPATASLASSFDAPHR